jgi:hypothetical protein
MHGIESLSLWLLSKDMRIETNKTVILLILLCWCEVWFLTVMEEHGLRVLKNRMLRRISGDCTKLHSGELHNLHTSPNTIREIKSRMMR